MIKATKTSEPLNNLESTERHSIFNPKDKLSERIVDEIKEEKKQILISRLDRARKADKLTFGTNKLLNYELVNDLSTLKVGSHIRYCQNVYRSYDEETKTHKRKSIYAVIKKKLNDNKFEVNSYGTPKFENWLINPSHKYKDLLIYIKPQKVYTGECNDCKKYVKYPYKKCYDCSMK